jgi:hypothetical protein
MADDTRLLVEQDSTVARVAETALRMMAGQVGPDTQRALQDALRRSPDAYPWQEVCDLVVAERVDPSQLVNRGIVAQRDWVNRPAAARTVPAASAARPKRPASNLFKRLLAMLIVRGAFYAVFASAFVVLLVLVQRRWSEVDIYALGRWVEDAVRGLLGR